MSDRPQSLASHARYVPAYHFVLFFILLVNLGYAGMHAWRHPGMPQAWVFLLLSVGLFIQYWYARAFAITVQDRVIRLEETLRMERLLPPELKPRIGELSRAQFIALRFASDGELPALVRKVLDERLTDAPAIKALVKQWRPDHLRA